MEQALILSNIGLWIFVVVQFFLFHQLTRLMGNFLQKVRLDSPVVQKRGLIVGDRAPDFRSQDHTGRETALVTGEPVVLIFTLPGCGICQQVFPRLKEARMRYSAMRWIVITADEGDDEKVRHLPADVPMLPSGEIRAKYAIKYVPAIVVLNARLQVIGNERVSSPEDFVERLEFYQELITGPVRPRRRRDVAREAENE